MVIDLIQLEEAQIGGRLHAREKRWEVATVHGGPMDSAYQVVRTVGLHQQIQRSCLRYHDLVHQAVLGEADACAMDPQVRLHLKSHFLRLRCPRDEDRL